jgi:hypothetical protein
MMSDTDAACVVIVFAFCVKAKKNTPFEAASRVFFVFVFFPLLSRILDCFHFLPEIHAERI